MPRKGPATKRDILPDPKYRDQVVTKFITMMMQGGKKGPAERIFYGAMGILGQRTGDDSVETFRRALENVKPIVEVRSRRVGGATYQVPVEVKPRRANTLAIRWAIGYSRQRREKSMALRLANELLDASNGIGASVKRREDLQKMAESNKAFAHYRW
jgi:small subunit ribosomal protein S7